MAATYLAEHGRLPIQGGWTAVTGDEDDAGPGLSYVATAAVGSVFKAG